jgi:hypothetical protein
MVKFLRLREPGRIGAGNGNLPPLVIPRHADIGSKVLCAPELQDLGWLAD